jgi:hypothetical protein
MLGILASVARYPAVHRSEAPPPRSGDPLASISRASLARMPEIAGAATDNGRASPGCRKSTPGEG